jgi:hypothetical protein
MDWIKKRTHVIDHPRFLEAGAVARDLYDWGMLYSGEHELDGELPMVAVMLSAWGAGGKGNVKGRSETGRGRALGAHGPRLPYLSLGRAGQQDKGAAFR